MMLHTTRLNEKEQIMTVSRRSHWNFEDTPDHRHHLWQWRHRYNKRLSNNNQGLTKQYWIRRYSVLQLCALNCCYQRIFKKQTNFMSTHISSIFSNIRTGIVFKFVNFGSPIFSQIYYVFCDVDAPYAVTLLNLVIEPNLYIFLILHTSIPNNFSNQFDL